MTAPPGILLAEDDPPLRRLVTRLLGAAGYEVVVAEDARQALDALGARRAGLVAAVLDAAILPGGALPLVDAIVAGEDGIGFVLVSGDALESDLAERAHAHGGVFLRKPFPPKALLEALDQARRAR